MAALPPIGGSPPVAPTTAVSPNKKSEGASDNPFEKLLTETVQDQKSSEAAVADLVAGKNDNVQQVVMQVVKSEMSFQLFMEVRNQLIESYNELMRMQF
ncbi:flagellar hook-basal body complex protein FliE [Planctomycetes bacterium K23_9]|uniref:Flagellar hook-basal body complex protein FliE n=1 Tax=Stieleria marina TaxID=1930275 RepID=A0A517NVL8_9BACT|nr:flagellar hook-basal body protein FliE [Planctomycetes bacterium K23_9]